MEGRLPIRVVPTDHPDKLETHPHMMAVTWGDESITYRRLMDHTALLHEWCRENVAHEDYHKWGTGELWAFAKAEDAFAFRMRWG